MKKFAKITGITILVLFIIGVVMAAIGAIGGGASALNKMASLGELSFGPEDLNFGKWSKNINVVYEIDDEIMFNNSFDIITADSYSRNFEGESISALMLNLSGGEVEICEGTKEYWEVLVSGVGRFQTYVENGTLYVLGVQEGLNVEVGEVTIYVPENTSLNSAQIALGAGAMEVERLSAAELEMSVGAGEIAVEKLQSDKAELSVGAGEILVNGGEIGELKANVGMGAMEVEGTIKGNIDANVSMGELCITVYGSEREDHNYDLSCAAGNLEVGGRDYSGVGVSMEMDNEAATTYKLDCQLGSIVLDFK
ncbi:MAG: DUF4097 family beta strand repeat protein [Lachnospiraceae bacterium]|nr:DUF4097 family beta strand repeat protein [Lachnospiraceae bacterium]